MQCTEAGKWGTAEAAMVSCQPSMLGCVSVPSAVQSGSSPLRGAPQPQALLPCCGWFSMFLDACFLHGALVVLVRL